MAPMADRADRLFDDAQELAPEDRAILALQLLDSVGELTPDVQTAWDAEVRRRLDEIDSGQERLASWAEARARIFTRG